MFVAPGVAGLKNTGVYLHSPVPAQAAFRFPKRKVIPLFSAIVYSLTVFFSRAKLNCKQNAGNF